jgi:succinate-semialdehyde dehydrogenase/glutarate-semialdehyde dehydrogenase
MNSIATIDVTNPHDGSVVGRVPRASVDDCVDAVRSVSASFPTWRLTPPRERGEILRRAFEMMIAQRDDLARLIVRENGKVLADAVAEVTYAAEFFRWFAEEAVRIDGDFRRAPSGANWLLVMRQPVGPSLLATPWNFPAAMATRKLGPVIATGCTAVLKPASDTPLTALAIVDILRAAGLPDGVVHVVVPDPPGDAVEAMLTSGLVRKLSFTGSTRVGSLLLATAARHVVNCSMELGGNAPLIVCDDADMDVAIDGAMLAKMRNGGAACTAANRFFVHESRHDEFVDRFTARMSALIVGDGMDPTVHVGSLISRAQQRRVADLVDAAVAGGATATCGARALDDGSCAYMPTVLVDVDPSAPILAEEIFGPVAPVVRFADINEVVARSNDVEQGLVSYVFTRDVARGMRIAEALETGMVGLNRGLVSDPSAPFGGVKASGLGREGAHEGTLEFLETKYVAGTW